MPLSFMVEHAPGITRLCDAGERRGWLTRERALDDRRVVRCQITEPGLAVLGRVDGVVHAADAAILACLSDAEFDQLIALLDRIRAGGSPPDSAASRPAV